jgi:hypothetical protein
MNKRRETNNGMRVVRQYATACLYAVCLTFSVDLVYDLAFAPHMVYWHSELRHAFVFGISLGLAITAVIRMAANEADKKPDTTRAEPR